MTLFDLAKLRAELERTSREIEQEDPEKAYCILEKKETRREGTFYLRVEKDLLTEVSAQVIPLVKVGFDNYNNKKEGDGT